MMQTSKHFKYPNHLIPTPTCTYISNFDNSEYLGHWMNGDIELRNEDGLLDASAIQSSRLPHLSHNKIPSSTTADLLIELTCEKNVSDTLNDIWTEGKNGICPEDNQWFFNETRQRFYYKIVNINGYSAQYEAPPGSGDTFRFTIYVVHKPTNINYWHFEFSIVNDAGEIIDKIDSKKSRGKAIASKIREKLQEIAVFEIE